MSDRNVGLLIMVKNHFPGAEHWYCGKHLLKNAPPVGAVGNDIFWEAAKATNVKLHEKAMVKLRLQVCSMFSELVYLCSPSKQKRCSH
jgi:hypothetical protein